MKDNIFEGYLLLSDLDGTLVTENMTIPKRNFEAIERFKRLGGKFSLATGRNFISVSKHNDMMNFNSPCIILNGGAIFDFDKNKFVAEVFLNKEKAKGYIQKILNKFPQVGIEVYVNDGICVVNNSRVIQNHIDTEQNVYRFCSVEDIKQPWYKIFLGMESNILNDVKSYAESICGDEIKFVVSSEVYFEILPATSTKGIAFKKLMEYLGINKEKACAIGDYYNDLALLKEAGISAVPENAPDDMKETVDVVVRHCEFGAVADFIEYLEKKIEFEGS